jgi:hypothetical protein
MSVASAAMRAEKFAAITALLQPSAIRAGGRARGLSVLRPYRARVVGGFYPGLRPGLLCVRPFRPRSLVWFVVSAWGRGSHFDGHEELRWARRLSYPLRAKIRGSTKKECAHPCIAMEFTTSIWGRSAEVFRRASGARSIGLVIRRLRSSDSLDRRLLSVRPPGD